MPLDFPMPQMGFDMTEAKIARWMKKEGDQVAPGEVLAEIATEKVNLELVDHPGGVIEKILVPEGQTVAVGTPIVRFADANGKPAAAAGPATPESKPASDRARAEEPTTPPASTPPAATPAAPPTTAAATPAADSATPSASPASAPPTSETSAAPPAAAPTAAPVEPAAAKTTADDARVKASPLARKLAESRGVDLSGVKGSGPMGRILRDDVLRWADAAAQAPATQTASGHPSPVAVPPRPEAPTPVTSAAPHPASGPIELSPMRQVIARRLQESKQQIPHFYLSTEVRMDRVVALRPELNAAAGEGANITINDFVIKAVALALVRNPGLNVWFVEGKIRPHERVNVGLAVALDEGLVVPALLDCQSRSLGQISVTARDLIQRARKGAVKPEEFTGGTFSISNLGMFGVDNFQAIINPPQVGILAVGAAVKKPVVTGDAVSIGTIMQICLSCDHRVVDGATGAKFLAEIKRLLESPMLMLL